MAAVLIAGIVLALHIYFLFHAGGFWRDEVNLLNLAAGHSLGALSKDSFPILMPLLVKGWTAIGLGQSDFNLRILGSLIGIGTIASVFGVMSMTRQPALFTLTLFGLNPMVIFYGDSIRGYGLGCLLIVLVTWAALAFLKEPSWLRCGILAALAVLCVQALYQNAALIAALCVGAWSVCLRRKDFPAALKILLVAVVAALSLLPYWNNIFALSQTADPLRVGFSPSIALRNFKTLVGCSSSVLTPAWDVLGCAVLVAGIVALKNLRQSRSDRDEVYTLDRALFAAVTLPAAFVAYAGVLWFSERLTEPWYFLPLACLSVLCADTGLWSMSGQRIRTVFLVAVIAAAGVEARLASDGVKIRFSNAAEVAGRINTEAEPADFVVVTPWFCGISFDRYRKPALAWETIPPLSDHTVHRYDLLVEQMKSTNALDSVVGRMAATLRAGHQVWVVSSATSVGAMKIPKDNEEPPKGPHLPPLINSGWAEWPYCDNWSAQVAWFLKNHSKQFEQVSQTEKDVNPYENLILFRAIGWKDFSQAN